MRRWLAMGVSFALLWLFVRGVDLVARLLVGEFLIGLAVGVPIAFVFRRFYRKDLDALDRLLACPYAFVYLLLFLKELITANLAVAYRVLAPWAPIEPDVVEFPLRVQTDLGIATIANSITLTPGTLTMDYDADAHSLYVHTIDGRDRDAVVEPIRSWERYALRIFDEPLEPDDPIPSPGGSSGADSTIEQDDADSPANSTQPDDANDDKTDHQATGEDGHGGDVDGE